MRWLQGWRRDLLLSAVAHAVAFAGLLWFGWSPGAVILAVSLQLVAIAGITAWRINRDVMESWSRFLKPTILPAILASAAVALLAVRLAQAAGDPPVLFWSTTLVAAAALFMPLVRRLRDEVRGSREVELSWRDGAVLVVRSALAFAVAFWGNTWIGWPLPPLPSARTLQALAAAAVIVGFACDAVQSIGRCDPRAAHGARPADTGQATGPG